jgi:hypothetical protein
MHGYRGEMSDVLGMSTALGARASGAPVRLPRPRAERPRAVLHGSLGDRRSRGRAGLDLEPRRGRAGGPSRLLDGRGRRASRRRRRTGAGDRRGQRVRSTADVLPHAADRDARRAFGRLVRGRLSAGDGVVAPRSGGRASTRSPRSNGCPPWPGRRSCSSTAAGTAGSRSNRRRPCSPPRRSPRSRGSSTARSTAGHTSWTGRGIVSGSPPSSRTTWGTDEDAESPRRPHMSAGRVVVRLFGPAREVVGADQVEVDLPAGATAGAALAALAASQPGLAGLLPVPGGGEPRLRGRWDPPRPGRRDRDRAARGRWMTWGALAAGRAAC